MKFVDYCRQYRCYREIERYFTDMDKRSFIRLSRLYALNRLPVHHRFAVQARKLEFVTRSLRISAENAGYMPLSNALSYGIYICSKIPCTYCWYERG